MCIGWEGLVCSVESLAGRSIDWTGAVVDRPRSGILLHALTLMGNERYGSLCVCVCVFVTGGQEREGFGAQALQSSLGLSTHA